MASSRGRKKTYPAWDESDSTISLHEHEVPDPFRNLEDKSTERTAWITAQRRLTNRCFASMPLRAQAHQAMQDAFSSGWTTLPRLRNGRYFTTERSGTQMLPTIRVRDSKDSPERLLIDPNIWSEDGSIALQSWSPSPDGTKLAYAVSHKGSSSKTWQVLDVQSGLPFSEINRAHQIAWSHDSSGFYFCDFNYVPAKDGEEQYWTPRLMFHKLGTSGSDDLPVAQDPSDRSWWSILAVGKRWLVFERLIKINSGACHIKAIDLSKKNAEIIELFEDQPVRLTGCVLDGNTLYAARSSDACSTGELIAVNLSTPDKAPRLVLPSRDQPITDVIACNKNLAVIHSDNGASRISIVTGSGKLVANVELPEFSVVSDCVYDKASAELLVEFGRLDSTPAVAKVDCTTGKILARTLMFEDWDDTRYTLKQVLYPSKDGTIVSMYVAARKDIVLNGQNNVILYGYGGFRDIQTPDYRSHWRAWLELGGVVAIANLRGGFEHGEAWHQAGMRLAKQNVFDDFIAAAEWLKQAGYADKVAIKGGSNGGLLVSACLVQRPDLFLAALPEFGVHDMLRFSELGGPQWQEDYGVNEDPEQFEYLLNYSPLHNVAPGTHYPPTLVVTSTDDGTVNPAHSYKLTAALQRAQGGNDRVLLLEIERAGHGPGPSTGKNIHMYSLEFAFVMDAAQKRRQRSK